MMALYIGTRDMENADIEWDDEEYHIGDTLPLRGSVVIFQADGDELDALMRGFRGMTDVPRLEQA
jgi:hypothetical protein